ncbi:hypothetical protein NZNM25_02030 [Nitrosopumilus zosterae]|uniref:Uncharacterized protein n=1 Tax=Nitrosopumilus zosterae TaxID=718286 RepID=A0A2S2KP46_9ARCH|nr:hypothetical protein [Nitrosopumilus zosterae]BDQ31202.1 hypothetical protein NZOSNM25_001313 [Nitrosopumilus zosterae]GBH33412.1 hypothetical protein NZNM25_02030 [Nitrosopumilus zosterae]
MAKVIKQYSFKALMLLEYLSVILYIMSFTLVPFIAVLGISLRVIKKKEQTRTYRKPQTELEEIMGF